MIQLSQLIQNCSSNDLDDILRLYDHARQLQASKNMVVWPVFESSLVETEIREKRQWKLVIDGQIACNWATTFADKDIWEERDKGDAVYIHRIATDPRYRGRRFVEQIVKWARSYALAHGKDYIRLDTLGNNTGLIAHYTSAGFHFLGIYTLKDTSKLPGHYQKEPACCLFEMPVAMAHTIYKTSQIDKPWK